MKRETKQEVLAIMIKNRETELQRAFDAYTVEKREIRQWIRKHDKELIDKNNRLRFVEDQIANCYARAIEQGYPNCLD